LAAGGGVMAFLIATLGIATFLIGALAGHYAADGEDGISFIGLCIGLAFITATTALAVLT